MNDFKDAAYANECREEYIAEMEAQGYKIIYPKSKELQIDIDSDDQYELYKRQSKSLAREIVDVICEIHPSRNGLPGRHVTITMPFNLSDTERIAWQAALGSDPFREIMSLFRLKRGDIHPTLFVEIKKEGEL